MSRTRFALALILTAGALFAVPVESGAARPHKSVSLKAGEAAFWNGPFIESSDTSPKGADDCSGAPCWHYEVRVRERAHRLRIGIDHPEVSDVFDVTVAGPDGSVATFSPGTGLYSAESLHPSPKPGVWKVDVRAASVTESAFRMRTKLEARAPGLGKGKILPNLQVLPPHDASFLHPVTNGSTSPSTGLDLEGASSCHPEEIAEEQAVRCLRFAYGIRNTGRGPLELYTDGQFPLDADLIQRVWRSNGSHYDRPAGMARYHKTHAHYHHHDAVGLQLFKVDNPKTGKMSEAGEMRTKGFAHRDELLREWHNFYPTWSKAGFGLLPGWADIYEWDRPGNYISMGLNLDGRYVLRMWADPVEGVIESNEKDNAGYTYFEVTGSDVKLLEAGRGKHPWDPCKIEMGFGGHPDPKQKPRPKSCPRDTT